ncbi:MAG: hypothetical protein EXR72_26025 [Myxococcales bacterium]|nr:hypothetical protein [Myxococcales bacterium]
MRLPLLALLLVAAPAWAYDIEIDSQTLGQGYQIAGGDGGLIARRRLDQYLGLHVWNLGPKDALGLPTARNQFYLTSSLRFSTDFGDYPKTSWGGRDVSQELGSNRFDLLYLHVGANDLAGFLDIRLGRQIDVGEFDFTSYDGLSVEARTPWYVALHASGGLLVNGALPFDSPIFRPDGTAPSGLSVHDQDYKPTLAVGARSFGFRDLDARFAYRHTWAPAQHTQPNEAAVKATDGTTEERLAWSLRGRLWGGRIISWAGLRYSLLVAAVDHIEAGARFTLSPRHALQIEYLYSYPTFDGDSIWNLFVRKQFDDVRLAYDLGSGRLRGYARAFVRFFHEGDDLADRVSNSQPAGNPGGALSRLDAGGSLGARLDLSRGFVRADAYADAGYGGRKIGLDVATRLRLYRELIAVEARLTYVNFANDIRPLDAGHSVGLQVGARLQLGRGILLHLLAEDNVNRFYASQLRLLAVLDLAFLLGSNGFSQADPRHAGAGFGGGY